MPSAVFLEPTPFKLEPDPEDGALLANVVQPPPPPAIAVATVVNAVVMFVPSVPTMPTIATEMPAAMRPYSMAVAPDSSLAKSFINLVMTSSS